MEILKSRTVGAVGVTELQEHLVRLPDGREKQAAVVRRPPVVGVAVLRLDASGALEVLLVDQYRPAVGVTVREIVAGKIEAHELDEDPCDVARRELAEEAGLRAETWQPLISGVLPSPGYADERITALFVAWDTTPVPSRPEDAHIQGRWWALDEALAQIGVEIIDAKTVISLLLISQRWQTYIRFLDRIHEEVGGTTWAS